MKLIAPPTPEALYKLYQGQSFVELSLYQAEFGAEIIAPSRCQN